MITLMGITFKILTQLNQVVLLLEDLKVGWVFQNSLVYFSVIRERDICYHVLFHGHTEDLALGDSLSSTRDYYEEVGEEQGVFAGKKKKWLSERQITGRNERMNERKTSQVNEFSAFLYVGSCTSLGLTEISLICTLTVQVQYPVFLRP